MTLDGMRVSFREAGADDAPDEFQYDFDGYADFLDRFVRHLGIERFAIYLHDFGSQIGLRLAMLQPSRIAALIIQNGDIYEDQFGPKYDTLRKYWEHPTKESLAAIADAVSEEGYRDSPGRFFPALAPALFPALLPGLATTLHRYLPLLFLRTSCAGMMLERRHTEQARGG